MKRTRRFFGVFVLMMVLFFTLIVVRVWAVKPSDETAVSPIPAGEYDPAVWGKTYPVQYASYQKNFEMAHSPTGYGGNTRVPKVESQPEILTNFKGNLFSEEYNERRGHPYAMEDLRKTRRVGPSTKGACITCKTPYVEEAYKQMGWGYANRPLTELMEKSQHPVSCANCHDPETMKLRITNPAFTEAMSRQGVDVTKASRQEMRSFVCAQCHSEYYFEPGTARVIFPWDKGLTPQAMYEYYSTKPNGFLQDYIQTDSKVPVLKAQHPDYEEWIGGTHAQFGVSCADCHMPYMRQRGKKYTSHWVASPMKYLDEACGTCHQEGKEKLYQQVKNTQDQVFQLQRIAGTTIAKGHDAIRKASGTANVNQKELDAAREHLRQAQWYWDYVASANSMGFHNSTQELNTLGQAVDFAHQAIAAANRAATTR